MLHLGEPRSASRPGTGRYSLNHSRLQIIDQRLFRFLRLGDTHGVLGVIVMDKHIRYPVGVVCRQVRGARLEGHIAPRTRGRGIILSDRPPGICPCLERAPFDRVGCDGLDGIVLISATREGETAGAHDQRLSRHAPLPCGDSSPVDRHDCPVPASDPGDGSGNARHLRPLLDA